MISIKRTVSNHSSCRAVASPYFLSESRSGERFSRVSLIVTPNNWLARARVIIEILLDVSVAALLPSRASANLQVSLPIPRTRSVGFPDEHATSRDNDILLYSPARRLAISPTKCQPRPRRAARREAYQNVIPSSRSPCHPGRRRFAFFELTTPQPGFIFRRGCIRFA